MALISTILTALLRKGVLVGLGVLLLIGLIEAVLWLAAPVTPYVTYRFEFQNRMSPLGLRDSSVFEVDSRELRTRRPPENKTEEIRILIVSGESSYAPVQSAEDTWWGMLASMLEKRHSGVGVRVDLKAVSSTRPERGTSMRHGLRWAKTYAPELKPDILAVSFGVSEVLDPPLDFQYDPTAMSTLSGLPRPRSLKDRAVAVSQIARRLRHWRAPNSLNVQERKALLEQPNYFLKHMGFQRTLYEQMPFDVSPPRREGDTDHMHEYLDGLRRFHALAERLGARLLVLGEPCLHDDLLGNTEMARLKRPRWLVPPSASDEEGRGLRPDPSWVERELERYYGKAAEWASKADVPFLNLNREEVLAKSTENFVDDVHLTLHGSRRVADEVLLLFSSEIKKILAK